MAGGRNRALTPSRRDIEQYLEENPEVAARLVEQRPEIVAAARITRRSHSGPIPAPDTLREYQEVMPGLDERIVRMAESEQAHRHGIDRGILQIVGRGQWLGFVLGLAGLLGGFGFTWLGMEGVGIAAVLSSIALLAGSLFFGRRGRQAVEGDGS